jgi:hypothetical protein
MFQDNAPKAEFAQANSRGHWQMAKPDESVLQPRQLLLGDAGAPHQFAAAHAARLAGVIQAGFFQFRFLLTYHQPMVTDSVKIC